VDDGASPGAGSVADVPRDLLRDERLRRAKDVVGECGGAEIVGGVIVGVADDGGAGLGGNASKVVGVRRDQPGVDRD
jgi:hypothetical protein